jgi:hypothetical protein
MNMTTLATNPVLLNLAAHATAARIRATELRVHEDAWIQEYSRTLEAKAYDALRKRRERRWNKVLGRRADGHVIRPIPPAGRSRYGAPVVNAQYRAELLASIQSTLRNSRQVA